MFITLEGGEGVGKSTQAPRLADALRGLGHKVLCTREPGGTPGADRLRGLLLEGQDWSPLAETLLHFAARAEHVAWAIRPALEAGQIVVCDRFIDSTMAYQGYGAGVDPAAIRTLSGLIGLQPDLTLMLELPPETAAARLANRGMPPDRYERKDPGFHARVAAGFRAIAGAEPDRCMRIVAEGEVEQVHAAIMAAVRARLPKG